jgi:acyl-CoA oxidase
VALVLLGDIVHTNLLYLSMHRNARLLRFREKILNKVFVPEEDRLAGINSFQDISKVPDTPNFPALCKPIGMSCLVLVIIYS